MAGCTTCNGSGYEGSGCRCRRGCSPCPPCDNAIPETCEPLETTLTAERVVVEDGAFCKRTLQTRPNSLILSGPDGILDWHNGGTDNPICLPQMQQQTSGNVRAIISTDSNGCLRRFTPMTGAGQPQVQSLYGDNTGNIYWASVSDTLPQSCGIYYRDCTDNQVKSFVGNSGDVLGFDSNGGPVSTNVNNFASIDGQSIYIYPDTGGATLNVSTGFLVLRNSIGDRRQITGGNWSINLSTTGAGGIDTGSFVANTLFWVYVILNPSTGTTSAIASLNSTAPTLPAGFTFYRLIGAGASGTSSPNWNPNAIQNGRRFIANSVLTVGGVQMYASGTLNTSQVITAPTLAAPIGLVNKVIFSFSYSNSAVGTDSGVAVTIRQNTTNGPGSGDSCSFYFRNIPGSSALPVNLSEHKDLAYGNPGGSVEITVSGVFPSGTNVRVWERGWEWNFI